MRAIALFMMTVMPSVAAPLAGQGSGIVSIAAIHLPEINSFRAAAHLAPLTLPQLEVLQANLGVAAIGAAKAAAATAFLQQNPILLSDRALRPQAVAVAHRGTPLRNLGPAIDAIAQDGSDDPSRIRAQLDALFEGGAQRHALRSRRDDPLIRTFLMGNSEWNDHKKTANLPKEWVRVNESLRSKIRSGWPLRGVPDEIGETVWEHSLKLREAALLYAVNRPEINSERAGLMALFHDVAEYLVPDFIPGEIEAKEKHRLELGAVDFLMSRLGAEASWIKDLWLEYEEGRTPEARLVKQLDKIDAVVQALRYEPMGYPVQDFYPHARARLSDPVILRLFDALMKTRGSSEDPYQRYFRLLGAGSSTHPAP